MAVSREQYQQLLKREQGRAGTNRDEAVRRANIAAGFGNSTAQRFMGAPTAKATPSGGGAARSASPYKLPKKAPRPQSRPDMTKTSSTQQQLPSGALRHVGGAGSAPANFAGGVAAPVPTPRPDNFSPDLAPSPNPYQPGSPVDPTQGIGAFQGPPMPQAPWLSPDLAPSPNPYAAGSPVNPHPLAMPPGNPGMAAAQALGAALGSRPFTGPMPRQNALGGKPIFGDYPMNTLEQYSLPKLW